MKAESQVRTEATEHTLKSSSSVRYCFQAFDEGWKEGLKTNEMDFVAFCVFNFDLSVD